MVALFVAGQYEEKLMSKLARDVMTPDPACCTPNTSLDEVAKLMAQNDCGEIPVVDPGDQVIGVVTDRDIVCRIVAAGKNPMAYTAETCMSGPVVTVRADAPLDDVVATMQKHQIRRVPVVDERDSCIGIISQADVSWTGQPREVANLVREVSRDTGRESR
jgi:CBS domain-containing protein